MDELIPILYQWLVVKYTSVKSFAFWKVSVEQWNFSLPVYKRVSLSWMKWKPSFYNVHYWSITTVLTLSTWKMCFKTDKFSVPVNQGFPSHEWKLKPSFNNVYYVTIYLGINFFYLKSGF